MRTRPHRGHRGEDHNMTAETKASKQTEEASEIIRAAKPTLRRRTRNSVVPSESLKNIKHVCRPAAAGLTDRAGLMGRDAREEGLKERRLSGKGGNT